MQYFEKGVFTHINFCVTNYLPKYDNEIHVSFATKEIKTNILNTK